MLLEALPGLLPRSRKVSTAVCLDGNREEPGACNIAHKFARQELQEGSQGCHLHCWVLAATSRDDGLPCNAERMEGKTAGERAAKKKQGEKGLEVR